MNKVIRYINPLTFFSLISFIYCVYLFINQQHDEYGLIFLGKYTLLLSAIISILADVVINNIIYHKVVKVIVQFISIPLILIFTLVIVFVFSV